MNVITANVGPKYAGYTEKLYKALVRNAKHDFNFICVTQSKYPGWWSKFAHFPIKQRSLWIDMDTVICGNVDFLFEYEGQFCIRANPWPWNNTGWCDASLIALSPEVGNIIGNAFLADPDDIMKRYRSDQELIASLIPLQHADTWQELYPGKTKSYKADCLEDGPDGASCVAFHGEPKPHQLNHDWIKEHWRNG